MEQCSKAVSSTPAAQRRPAVKNILKSVESHVRLMSHLENTSTSSNYTSLRLKNTQTDTWSDQFSVTRVHRGTPSDVFYQEVIAPCVASCMAGQSYLFLVSGPCESGRSQTLYGSPHHSEKGIIEYAAEDLLRHATGSTETNETGGSRATVTHSAFVTRGAHIVETVTGDPVPIVEFPPPLGFTALPHMQLLDSAPGAVRIPSKKHMDTSCIVQFQVYTPVDASGRRSMATLTFVDVAAFRPPHCSEVRHLVETVRRVAGISGGGGDPCFKQTKLTMLLEPALMGYVTLISVTTISGRPDLHEAACDALRFAETLSRIHQVLMLVHINTPKWLMDTAEKLEDLRAQRERILLEQHGRGVYDFYRTATKWLAEHVGDVDGAFDKLLEETENIRQDVAREVNEQIKDIQTHIQEQQQECAAQLERTRAAHAMTTLQLEKVKRLDETIAALDQQFTQGDFYTDHKISEMRIEISTLENETSMHRQELTQLEKEERLYTAKYKEIVDVLDKYAEDINYAQMHFAHATEMNAINCKRQRLEMELELASRMAHRTTDALRVNRERRSKFSRLTMMQQKVDALRERVHSNSITRNKGRVPSECPDDSISVSPGRRRQRHVSLHYSGA